MAQQAHQSYVHNDPTVSEETLAKEAADHLDKSPALQALEEWMTVARQSGLPCYGADRWRASFGAAELMRVLAQRPDLRQAIMTSLTGLPAKTARRKTPEEQAALIDDVLLEDKTPEDYRNACTDKDLVVYGPAARFHAHLCESFPWDEDTKLHQEFVAESLLIFLKNRGAFKRFLTPIDVLTAIDPDMWLERIPKSELRKVHVAHLELERDYPKKYFHAKDILAIVTPHIIAKHIPLIHLKPLFELAGRNMGFEAKVAEPTASQDATIETGEGEEVDESELLRSERPPPGESASAEEPQPA